DLLADLTWTVADVADPAAREYVDTQLHAFNAAQSRYFAAARVPGLGAWPLEIYVRNRAARIVGGLVATTIWDWMYVELLWVDTGGRGQELGRRLMAAAEAAAQARGCRHAHLRTFSFQARGFYEKCGYRVIGRLDDYPPGGAFYWLRKDF